MGTNERREHTFMFFKLLSYFLSLVIVFVFCGVLSGCSFQFKTDTKDLMNPPTLTQEQAKMKETLTLAAGDSNIKYKYPQNGDYHSSFILYDLDKDNSEEALVFYQAPSRGDSTWLNILDKENQNWISVCEFPAPGVSNSNNDISVDFVSFEYLSDDEYPNIIIGWIDSRKSKTVVVYSYSNNILTEIFDKDYGELVITDLDRNGIKDMVILTPETKTTQVFLASRTSEGFNTVSSTSLNHAISSFASITEGRFSYNKNAIFIDENLDVTGKTSQYTDVISAENIDSIPRLVNLLDDSLNQLSPRTRRPKEDIFCRDIDEDKDGIIEIPTMVSLPGYDASFEGEQMYLTSYNIVEDGMFIPRLSGVINNKHRYMITFPDKWLDEKVTVFSQPESGEWTFIKYNGSISDTSVPLLRIRVYSTKDYQDKFESDYFQLIGQKGLFEYYASIPNITDELAITKSELENMFHFLEDDA